MKLQILKKGKNRLKLRIKDADLDNAVRAKFTVTNKNARHSQYAAPTSSPITPLGTFKAGILKEIVDYVSEFYPDVEIDYSQVNDIINPFFFLPLQHISIQIIIVGLTGPGC